MTRHCQSIAIVYVILGRMKMKKYLKFIKDNVPQNTWTYYVGSDSMDRLGVIKYFGRWRQYCFFPANDMVFSSGCLREIEERLKVINAEWWDIKRVIKENRV